MSEDNEFLKQFSGSAAANVVLMICVGLYKLIESRCKHSRCSSNTSCFKCSVDNDQTIRGGNINDQIRAEESVSKLQTSERQEV